VVTTLKTKSVTKWTWSGARFVRESPNEKQLVAPKFTLVIYRARYYDPTTGEFISRDPLEYVDGMSQYRAYFALDSVDPLGLDSGVCPSGWTEVAGPGPPPYTDLYGEWRNKHWHYNGQGPAERKRFTKDRYHFYDFEWEKIVTLRLGCRQKSSFSGNIEIQSSQEISVGGLANTPLGEFFEIQFGYTYVWGTSSGGGIQTPMYGGDDYYQKKWRKKNGRWVVESETETSKPFWWNTTVYWNELGIVVCKKKCKCPKDKKDGKE